MSLITEPGRYLTRGGEEVDVYRNDNSSYPWAYGCRGGLVTTDDDGYQLRRGNPVPSDIVAKAPEAAPTKEEVPRLDDGGPAFPMPEPNIPAGHYYEGPGAHPGMTLRHWFAGQALIGALSRGGWHTNEEGCAEYCFRYADAMIKAGRSA